MPLSLLAHPGCIRTGRSWVTAEAVLCGVGSDILARVRLLGSELIANAVLHGPTDGVISVRAGEVGGQFRVEVDDQGLRSPQVLRPPPTAAGGRGMLLVDAYATRWGCVLRPPAGKTVWFEVDCD